MTIIGVALLMGVSYHKRGGSRSRFDILIAQFIRVQFQAGARWPNQPQPRRVGGGKARGLPRSVHRMPIHDQIDLASHLFEEPLQERHTSLRNVSLENKSRSQCDIALPIHEK